MSKERLAQLYVQGSEHNRTMPPDLRRDWSIGRGWISAVHPSTEQVLDVGSFSGDFLNFLGDNYQRYGNEIHPVAKKSLSAREIMLFGTDIDALNGARQVFDCIAAFDIIEHEDSPKNFLSQCFEALYTSWTHPDFHRESGSANVSLHGQSLLVLYGCRTHFVHQPRMVSPGSGRNGVAYYPVQNICPW